MSTAQPYRESDVREGVPLRRQVARMRGWRLAIASISLIQVAVAVWIAKHYGPTLTLFEPKSLVLGSLACGVLVWLVSLAIVSMRVVSGRSRRSGALFLLALAPVLAAELFLSSNLDIKWVAAIHADLFSLRRLELFALVRLALYATSAVGFAMVAAGCVGGVMSVVTTRPTTPRPPRPMQPTPAKIGINALGRASMIGGLASAIAFTMLRAHGTHRDDLGGVIAVMTVALASIVGPILARHVQGLADWHDAVEARATARAAFFAVLSIAFVGVLTERAVLAHDEHTALRGIEAFSFDVRLEYAQAFSSAWREHLRAIAIVLVTSLLPLASIVRSFSLARVTTSRGKNDFLLAIAGVVVTTLLIAHVEMQTRSTLTPAKLPALPPSAMTTHTELPIAPAMRTPSLAPDTSDADLKRMAERAAAIETPIALGADGKLRLDEVSPPASKTGPFVLVTDRRTPTADILAAALQTKELQSIMVEGASERVTSGLSFTASALLGPRRQSIDLAMVNDPFLLTAAGRKNATRTNMMMVFSVLLVLDDGEVARLVYRQFHSGDFDFGVTHGMSLRRDSEAREQRQKLAELLLGEVGFPIRMVVLAPNPRGDAQALVDALLAVQEICPKSIVGVTTEHQELESWIMNHHGNTPEEGGEPLLFP